MVWVIVLIIGLTAWFVAVLWAVQLKPSPYQNDPTPPGLRYSSHCPPSCVISGLTIGWIFAWTMAVISGWYLIEDQRTHHQFTEQGLRQTALLLAVEQRPGDKYGPQYYAIYQFDDNPREERISDDRHHELKNQINVDIWVYGNRSRLVDTGLAPDYQRWVPLTVAFGVIGSLFALVLGYYVFAPLYHRRRRHYGTTTPGVGAAGQGQ